MAEIDYQRNVEQMLIVCGDPGRCKACGADIWWMKTRNGKVAPYTKHGVSHFMDCPKAEEFRVYGRKKKKPEKQDDLNIEEGGE